MAGPIRPLQQRALAQVPAPQLPVGNLRPAKYLRHTYTCGKYLLENPWLSEKTLDALRLTDPHSGPVSADASATSPYTAVAICMLGFVILDI